MVRVTTVVVIQSDWTRTLLTPLRALAWCAYLYFVLVSVLAVAGVAFVFLAGLGSGLLMATLVGIPLLALVVMSGRAWNRLYRSLARLIGVTIDAPPPFVRPPGRLHTLAAAMTDAVGWRSLGFLALHALLMTPIGYVVLVVAAVSAVSVGSPVVWLATGEPFMSLGEPVDSLGPYLLLSAGGVVALYSLGWLMLGLGRAHAWLARALLGPTERERRVVQLEQARAGVVDDSAGTLRRVERDLHDGTQARLITVAMASAPAEQHFASSEVTRGRGLVADALANTADTLTELRDLVRGIHPRALDRGLSEAVQTLAARSPIPVEVVVDLAARL